ncbi:MAG: hypothetical protein JNM70_06445 [Anaerolineae bacterium]|nr:hypothetical protein [Anaerolineae bacterium]
MISLSQLTSTLDANAQRYTRVTLAGDMSLIVAERGARIFGPFLADGTPLCWINPALGSADTFRAFIANGEWNQGGERVWIAPEIQFNIPDRARFWETHRIVPQMDPGAFRLMASESGVRLEAEMQLEAFNLARGMVDVKARHDITTVVPNPLRQTRQGAALMEGVAYAGYSRSVSLSLPQPGSILCEAWCLIQLNPGGTLTIPVTSESAEATTYFGDPAPDSQAVVDGALRIHLTGQRQYKLGYKAAYITGRMGYLNHLPDGRGFFLIRNFFNNPSSVYAEEPDNQPGANGHSVHVYNDGGQYGSNGEMECNGRTIGGETGRSHTQDDFIMWVYVGAVDALKQIGRVLLGVSL